MVSKKEAKTKQKTDTQKVNNEILSEEMTPSERWMFERYMEKIDDLTTTVKDGLTERVTRIERITYLIVAAILIEAVLSRIF